MSKPLGRWRQILWPSQNILSLPTYFDDAPLKNDYYIGVTRFVSNSYLIDLTEKIAESQLFLNILARSRNKFCKSGSFLLKINMK